MRAGGAERPGQALPARGLRGAVAARPRVIAQGGGLGLPGSQGAVVARTTWTWGEGVSQLTTYHYVSKISVMANYQRARAK